MATQQLLLSGVLDVRHRFLRAYAGVDEAILSADQGTRTVLSAFRTELRALLREFHDTVSPLILASSISYPNIEDWDTQNLVRLTTVATNGFDDLSGLHANLCRYLPASGPTREDLGFMLNRALGLSLMSRSHAAILSVHQSEMLNWEATSYAANGIQAAAIAVPWVETLTPLRWPLAVHELGHYFLPGGQSVESAIQEVADPTWGKRENSAFEEIVADAVAQRHFGDAYAFALAREGYLLSYKRHSEQGTSILKRLQLLGGPADFLSALPPQWELGQRETGDDHTPDIAHGVAGEMRAKAVEMLDSAAAAPAAINRPEVVAAARDLMRRNEPVAAVTGDLVGEGTSEALGVLVASLVARSPELEPHTVDSITRLAVQVPITDGEILEAAWREECERDQEYFVAVLGGTELTDDQIDIESREIFGRDTWLARGLQSAAVHRWLVEAEALERDLPKAAR